MNKLQKLIGILGLITVFAIWGGAQTAPIATVPELKASSKDAVVGISASQKSAVFQDGNFTWIARGGIVTVEPGLTAIAGKGYIFECRLKHADGERQLWTFRLELKAGTRSGEVGRAR